MTDALHQLDLEAIARRLLEHQLPAQTCVDLAQDFGRAVEMLHGAGVDESRPLRAWFVHERGVETGSCVVVSTRKDGVVRPPGANTALAAVGMSGGADVAILGKLPTPKAIEFFEL